MLENAQTATFDVTVCSGDVPPIGENVSVVLKTGYGGRLVVQELVYVAAATTEHRRGVLLQLTPAGGRAKLEAAIRGLVECVFPHSSWQGEDAYFGMAIELQMVSERPEPKVTSVRPASIEDAAHRALLRDIRPLRVHAFDWDPAYAAQLDDEGPLQPAPTEFPLIADGGRSLRNLRALAPCEHCQALARFAGALHFVCDECIREGKLATYGTAACADALNRTPRVLGFANYPNWPICCGEPAPFIGVPRKRDRFKAFVDAGCRLYEAGKSWKDKEYANWSKVFCFQCSKCQQRYVTYRQTTGCDE
jgi:hypothetical protein